VTSAPSTTTTGLPAVSTDAVTVKDFAFGPRSISVKAGTTVTWTNQDGFDHSIVDKTSAAEGPHFGPIAGKTTYSRSYDAAGEFPYYCGIHNSMTGTVIVTS
jgi:plastocyanin